MEFITDLDQDAHARFLRGLKGGSGGGSGGGGGGGRSGGYSGGSSSYYGGSRGSTYYSSSSSSGDVSPNTIVIITIVAVVLGCLCFCFWKKNGSQSSGAGAAGSDSGFDAAVASARQKLESANISEAYATSGSSPAFQTFEGDFDVQYMDRGKQLSSFVKIKLMNTGGQYKIEGDCSDADGSAKITEGFASHSGDAWWVEQTFSGNDAGLKVLTEGRFDFEANEFRGKWRANTGVSGTYTSFKGKNCTKTFSPGGAAASAPQTLEQMLEVDIPMAHATYEDAPVVQAVPEVEQAIPTVSGIPAPSAPPAEPYVPNKGKWADVSYTRL